MKKPLLYIPENRRAVVIKNRLAAQKSFLKKKAANGITSPVAIGNKQVKSTSADLMNQCLSSSVLKFIDFSSKSLVIPSLSSINIESQIPIQI